MNDIEVKKIFNQIKDDILAVKNRLSEYGIDDVKVIFNADSLSVAFQDPNFTYSMEYFPPTQEKLSVIIDTPIRYVND